MAEITLLTELIGSMATDDGAHGLFKFATENGNLEFAVPQEELGGMISGAARALRECQTNAGHPAQVRQVFETEWWDFRRAGELVVMSFQLPGGAPLNFAIHRDRIDQMIAALQLIRDSK